MKVPIQYKSSDRYNAGVDVVYNDGSKLQYPPFVYATTASGDNGGDDEEGEEESMLIIENSELALDKSFDEIKTSMSQGKVCVIQKAEPNNATALMYAYVAHINEEKENNLVTAITIYGGSPSTLYYHEVNGVMTEYSPD